MKITNRLFLLFILLANITNAQDWVKTDITNFSYINFPVESQLTETSNEKVYSAEDEVAFYIVSIRKLTDQQSSRITHKDIPSLYQGVAQGAMDAANAEIVSMNDIIVQTIPALELEYNAPNNSGLPIQRFKRIIYTNQNIISVDFWPLSSEKDITNKKKAAFFNSLLINSTEVENNITVTDDTSKTSIASETGFLVGKVIFYLILIAFLIGIFLLIIYVIKKNKNRKPINYSANQPKIKTEKMACKNCDFENSSSTKYCTRCGYELPRN
nr:hypothetical protein [uncultured Psychroserpens sp.]